jgi:hypothetical protein
MALTAAQKRAVAEQNGLINVDSIWVESGRVSLPFYIACAIMQKESQGRNVYGHDVGGALSGFPDDVNRHNFRVFEWLVFDQGQKSNGVGPAQITFSGHFPAMKREGLRPWNVGDNMFYGFRLFKGYLDAEDGDIADAGERYNGSRAYGEELAAFAAVWKKLIQR